MTQKPVNLVLNVEYLHSLSQEMDTLERTIRESQDRLKATLRRYQSAAELLGVDPRNLPPLEQTEATAEAAPQVRQRRRHLVIQAEPGKVVIQRAPMGSWTGAILEILERANRGLPHAAIMRELKASDFAKSVTFTDKRYYTTIARMQKREQVERAGALIYAPKVAQRMKQHGALPTRDLEEPQLFNNKVQTPNLIRRILVEKPEGLEGPDLIGRLNMMEEAPDSVRTHPQFVYTTLLNMIRRNEIKKVGRVYRLAENESGPAVRAADPLH